MSSAASKNGFDGLEASALVRRFASKIADSIVEGAQAATDKQDAEFAGAVGAVTEMPAAESTESTEYTDDGEAISEEINLEEVLGGNIRKSPAAAAAASAEAEAAVEER